ncbi:GNAT family N-acetyltransferase [Paenibacillus albicereus]|uniref:GNAT family N-acetyltransferase n=1 Tax=Paenibacillus albicereus TaxID=2726185 RepID=A0A6H2GTT7_9BACL|nr:GNAT family N-acetyltransferase [Paenibacillus albicereus]QJC50844.1 GNAT family N-acetyltransferase [Paenibacillus albicereus]
MTLIIEPCGLDRKQVLLNLYPLYLHDLAGIRGVLPNRHGVFEEDDGIATLQEQQAEFAIWWEKEGLLFPYLLVEDGLPAGFALVASGPYAVDGSEFTLQEFFLLRPYRGQGRAERAARELFCRHPGRWALFTTASESNAGAISFWRRTLRAAAPEGAYEEKDEDMEYYGFGKLFRFRSVEGAGAAPGNAAPGSAAPGNAAPSNAAPGSAAPGRAAPDSATPGSAGPDSAAPDSAAPGSAAPGRAAPSNAAPGGSPLGRPAASPPAEPAASPLSSGITLRLAAADADLDALAELDALVVGHGGRREALAAHAAASCCLLAEREGRLAGYAAWDRGFFGREFLQLLIVHPAERRAGIGRTLLLGWLERCSGERAFTSTNRSNEPMRALLEAAGFEASGIVDHLDEGDPELVFSVAVASDDPV